MCFYMHFDSAFLSEEIALLESFLPLFPHHHRAVCGIQQEQKTLISMPGSSLEEQMIWAGPEV